MTMTQTFNRIHPLMAAAVCRWQRVKWRGAGVDSHYPYRNLHLRFGASGDRQSFDYELASSLLSPNAEWVVHRP